MLPFDDVNRDYKKRFKVLEQAGVVRQPDVKAGKPERSTLLAPPGRGTRGLLLDDRYLQCPLDLIDSATIPNDAQRRSAKTLDWKRFQS